MQGDMALLHWRLKQTVAILQTKFSYMFVNDKLYSNFAEFCYWMFNLDYVSTGLGNALVPMKRQPNSRAYVE